MRMKVRIVAEDEAEVVAVEVVSQDITKKLGS